MPQETERKFLVQGEFKSFATQSIRITQGYLSSVPERTVRVRTKGDNGFLTIKGKADISGVSRYEWEKEIPFNEARELLQLCEPGIIDKIRYNIPCGKHTYEVDVFCADNEGLIIAEIELSEEGEKFTKPSWLGREVTGEQKYYNSMLSRHPYSKW